MSVSSVTLRMEISPSSATRKNFIAARTFDESRESQDLSLFSLRRLRLSRPLQLYVSKFDVIGRSPSSSVNGQSNFSDAPHRPRSRRVTPKRADADLSSWNFVAR